MKTEAKTPRQYWATPVLGLVIGIVYQVSFALGGRPLDGAIAPIMVAFSVVIALAGRRSETVRGLLDRRDERTDRVGRGSVIAALGAGVCPVVFRHGPGTASRRDR